MLLDKQFGTALPRALQAAQRTIGVFVSQLESPAAAVGPMEGMVGGAGEADAAARGGSAWLATTEPHVAMAQPEPAAPAVAQDKKKPAANNAQGQRKVGKGAGSRGRRVPLLLRSASISSAGNPAVPRTPTLQALCFFDFSPFVFWCSARASAGLWRSKRRRTWQVGRLTRTAAGQLSLLELQVRMLIVSWLRGLLAALLLHTAAENMHVAGNTLTALICACSARTVPKTANCFALQAGRAESAANQRPTGWRRARQRCRQQKEGTAQARTVLAALLLLPLSWRLPWQRKIKGSCSWQLAARRP